MYVLVAKLLFYLQIDDPVDAIPIHGVIASICIFRDAVPSEPSWWVSLTEKKG